MEKRQDKAVAKFREGYNCAQSVLYSFCADLGLDEETALKISCGFGGGMGRKEEVCGAVSGGIMAIGARFGRGRDDDRAALELTYAKTRELMDLFAGRHGTFICRGLLEGCDLLTEEGHQRFVENGLRKKVCVPCIRTVVELVSNIIGQP